MRMLLLIPFLALPTLAAQPLYQPAEVCEANVHPPVEVSYLHPLTGLARSVRIVVEEPVLTGEVRPLPSVIWMHGGAGGGNPNNLAEWRRATAEACYLSVTIGHSWLDAAQARALCNWVGRTYPDECGLAQPGQVKLLNIERPFDLRAVLDHLLRDWDERIDPERVAVGGHSAGAGAALMVAGALRAYGERVEGFPDPRPRAYLVFSPQGPASDGFFESEGLDASTSFEHVQRPVLVGTGAGDSTCDSRYRCLSGETPSNRSAVFDLLPASPGPGPEKYRLYVNDPGAVHGRFGLGRARCTSTGGPVPDLDCDRVIEWLKAAAVGFLDGHLRERGEARAWLKRRDIERVSGGTVRWASK